MNDEPTNRRDPGRETPSWGHSLLGPDAERRTDPMLFGQDLETDDDDLADFTPGTRGAAWRRAHRPGRLVRWAALSLLTVGIGAIAWYTAARPGRPDALPNGSGHLSIETRPPGATVIIDGLSRGMSPLVVALDPGEHVIEVRSGTERREVPVSLAAAERVSQYFEFVAAPATGQLQVDSDPPGARVAVDGEARGVAPLLLADLQPGPHAVLLESNLGTVERQITVEPGTTASLFVPLSAKGAPLSGWVSIAAPVELQIFEGGRLVGTTLSERIMMAAGRHEIELVNDTLAFRDTRALTVAPGRTTAVPVDLPKGTLSVNATPWAEVWIDGRRMGETPLGNLAVPIGPHEVVFRHPQMGEQRHAITVTLAAPARLSVNLRRQEP